MWYSHGGCVVWIDAICIDEQSVEEKNQQVPLMCDIYSWASATVVWLGPAGDDSDVAMSCLPALADKYKE